MLNLRGTGYVARDFEPRRISATLRNGQEVEVEARFAGLEGYLLAKMCALRERGFGKDYYDFVYVLLFNTAGGPAQAARGLRSGRSADVLPGLSGLLREVEARFSGPESYGAASYARQAKIADPEDDVQVLAQDAVAAVNEFFDALRQG